MAKNILVNGQRETLLEWLAAEYDTALIQRWAKEREWPPLTKVIISYYRQRYKPAIQAKLADRRSKALTTGLAVKEERVERLKRHADALEAIKWECDEKGRLWNEKAWRETLDDIAREMGERRTVIDLRLVREEARRLADTLGLDPDAVLAEAERIVARR